MTKARVTHSEYVVPFGFPLQKWLRVAPQFYFMRTLPALSFYDFQNM
jgi:hypothetical protein